MGTVVIYECSSDQEHAKRHEFKSHLNAFMAAYNAALRFWREHSEEKFPSDNLVGANWHFEPVAGNAINIEIKSAELVEHRLYLLCELEALSKKLDRQRGIKTIALIKDQFLSASTRFEFSVYNKQGQYVLRYNPKLCTNDYQLYQALRRVELCYDAQFQQMLYTRSMNDSVPFLTIHDILIEEVLRMSAGQLAKLNFPESVFDQVLDILISDYDVKDFRQTIPDMKKVLLANAEKCLSVNDAEDFSRSFVEKKRTLNLAAALNTDCICGTSYVTLMGAAEDERNVAKDICRMCAKENLSGNGVTPGYEVVRNVFRYLGLSREYILRRS